MPSRVERGTYSARSRAVALFVIFAVVLGGGGTPNPTTEVLLQLVFVIFACTWLWLPAREPARPGAARDRLAIALALVLLVLPALQLIPLPPSVWTALPGRANEVAALALIGEQDSWRPISMSPSRTIASFLAIVPAAFSLYAVSRLGPIERRLVLAAIAGMALISSLVGAAQLVARGSGFNLYSQYSVGWITGFQANRNSTADVLLIGLLALAAIAAPYLAGNRKTFHFNLDRRMFSVLVGALGLLLLVATLMTGSRAGILLVIAATGAALAIVMTERGQSAARGKRWLIVPIAFVLLTALAIYFVTNSGNTALGRSVSRFSDVENSRSQVWEDTRYAIAQFWPVGVGLGGFVPALLPAERLEVLDPLAPNRAHNEYLELGLEAGILGYFFALVAVFVCLTMVWRTWRDEPASRSQLVFGSTVLLLIALHSVVDYPLRSMAIACLAGVAGGMLARPPATAG